MLTVILGILKVIGMLLLLLLGIALLLVLLVLFCPVRYSGFAAKEADKKPKIHADITWFLHFLRITFTLKDMHPAIGIRLLGISVDSLQRFRDRFRKKDKPQKTDTDATAPESQKAEKTEPESEEGVPLLPEDDRADRIPEEEKQEEIQPETEKQAKETIPRTEKKEKPGKAAAFLEKIKAFFRKLLAIPAKTAQKLRQIRTSGKKIAKNVAALKAFTDRQETRAALSLALEKTICLLKHIRPRKLEGELSFGLEDPADTGMVLAAIAPFYPFYGECLQLYPDFQQKTLSFSLVFKGRIYGFMLLYVALKLFFDKNMQFVIRKIRKRRSE